MSSKKLNRRQALGAGIATTALPFMPAINHASIGKHPRKVQQQPETGKHRCK